MKVLIRYPNVGFRSSLSTIVTIWRESPARAAKAFKERFCRWRSSRNQAGHMRTHSLSQMIFGHAQKIREKDLTLYATIVAV